MFNGEANMATRILELDEQTITLLGVACAHTQELLSASPDLRADYKGAYDRLIEAVINSEKVMM